MNIKKLFEKTSAGLKEFAINVAMENVIGLKDSLNDKLSKSEGGLIENPITIVNTDCDNPTEQSVLLSCDGIVTTGPNNTYDISSSDCIFNVESCDINGCLILNGGLILSGNIEFEKELKIKYGDANKLKINGDNTVIENVLSVGYDGIKYNSTTNKDNILFNVDSDGNCTANSFNCRKIIGKSVSDINIAVNNIVIKQNNPVETSFANLYNNQLEFTRNYFNDNLTLSSSTIYSANNIRKDNNTYVFPDKSGTIELVDEEKDNKLKQIVKVSSNIGYQYSTSFGSFEPDPTE